MPILEMLLVAGVLLTIVDLIVRDQAQYRLSRLRSELMALKSEEKRLAKRRQEVELMVAQIGDALMRTDRRKSTIDKGSKTVSDALEKLDQLAQAKARGNDEGAQADR